MQALDVFVNSTSDPWNITLWTDDYGYYNNTTDTDLQQRNQFILPWWRQMIWTLLFAGMIIVATGGNLIVIWIVLAHKRMRTVTNYFLVNLSIADAMVSTLNVTFNYIYMLNSHWPFGTLYCKICQFIAVLTICASVFTLMAISIDRYMAIMNPLRPHMGRRATLCVAIVIWIVGAILSLPMLLFYTTYTQNFANGEVRVICYGDFPNKDQDGLSYGEYLYNVIFTVLTYFLPIGSMTFTYARIGLELWGSQSIGENTAGQLESIRSKRRISTRIRSLFLLVSRGERASRALVIAIRSANISLQLHRKPSNAHPDITERHGTNTFVPAIIEGRERSIFGPSSWEKMENLADQGSRVLTRGGKS
ncbi:tachykinin-like peptides receptor 99D isoform X5 [Osmia bicornis bicornis]|uniref:tachykinin-like peptides receptor 99D isoform X5 n=1 Tax=Osmia bicornis bicornis TaxID=1437191 RepID=UPI001EAF3CCD|nr:tachykinin-like peptides receptor 99D isoform X5 [Osmia bicornis bicornis]